MSVPNWSPRSPEWSNETFTLLNECRIKKRCQITINHLTEQSRRFPINFPIHTSRCEILRKFVCEDILERNINSTYPIVHENVLEFYCKFILFKRKYGSIKEKALYKKMGLMDFIKRLLTKRAVVFVNMEDSYLLLNGKSGAESWGVIGTGEEFFPLILRDCLKYDEIKCSVFLSVSSYTYFINIGDRKNMGQFKEDCQQYLDDGVQYDGVIISLIGPRCVTNDVMESEEIAVSSIFNTVHNGHGSSVLSNSIHKLFAEFYEEECLDYKEVIERKKHLPINDKRYTSVNSKCLFDNHVYYKRLLFSIDTLLMESNFRAKLNETTAYVHVVGIGLGAWSISPHQDEVFMETFAKRISLLGQNLHSVSDICFAYINRNKCGDYSNGQIFPIKDHPFSGITIHIYNREPHARLVNEHEGKLLVVSYAGDGNALPGNEYWFGDLDTSSASAAASSTQIAELHNPQINPSVCADNLMVVTKDDVVPFENYHESTRYIKSKRNLDQ